MNNSDIHIFTETPWEDRNLSIKSFALHEACLANLKQSTLANELDRLQHEFGKFFVFARLSKTHLNRSLLLQQSGFYLVEGTVCPVIQFNKSLQIQAFDKDRSAFIPARLNGAELNFTTLQHRQNKTVKTITAIAKESFSNDRFHEDFQCPETVANRRFELWIADLLDNKEVTFDIVEVHGETAGFMARKMNDLIIAGFSKKYVRAGLGDYLWLGSLQRMQRDGLRYAQTLVSTNNIPSLNLHARLGFKFRNPQYSFHRWQN